MNYHTKKTFYQQFQLNLIIIETGINDDGHANDFDSHVFWYGYSTMYIVHQMMSIVNVGGIGREAINSGRMITPSQRARPSSRGRWSIDVRTGSWIIYF